MSLSVKKLTIEIYVRLCMQKWKREENYTNNLKTRLIPGDGLFYFSI